MPIIARGALAWLVLLTGCVSQQTTVLESSQQAQANAGVVAPRPAPRPVPFGNVPVQCRPPRNSGPYAPTPRPVNNVQVHKPQRVIDEHVAGCASVRFRINPDGSTRDVEILAEYPAGYELGAMVADGVKQLRYPPTDDFSWRFFNVTVVPKS